MMLKQIRTEFASVMAKWKIISDKIISYRMHISMLRHRAERIDQTVNEGYVWIETRINNLHVAIRPSLGQTSWFKTKDDKYNTVKPATLEEKADRWIWAHIVAPSISWLYDKIYLRLKRIPVGKKDELETMLGAVQLLDRACTQLTAKLEYALTPRIDGGNGDLLTPIQFRDKMVNAKEKIARERQSGASIQEYLHAAWERFEFSIAYIKNLEFELTHQVPVINFEMVENYYLAKREEIDRREKVGLRYQDVAELLNEASDNLLQFEPMADAMREVYAELPRIFHLYKAAGNGADKTYYKRLLELADKTAPRAWENHEWDGLEMIIAEMKRLIESSTTTARMALA